MSARVAARPRGAAAVIAGVTGATLLAWIATARLMGGMDAGPGTPLGGFGWFVVSWVVMMAAMMLPAELRFTLAYAHFARGEGGAVGTRVAAFLTGYLLAWTVFGALAWGGDRVLRALAPAALGWAAYGPWLAGLVVGLAGLYQVSPWKARCLEHCVSPLAFFMQRWRPGHAGGLRLGLAHGAWCIGCCWLLMTMLFALGVMSLFWMALLTVLMFAEKVLPLGRGYARGLAVALLVLGGWVAVAPASVPGLTLPGMPGLHGHHPGH